MLRLDTHHAFNGTPAGVTRKIMLRTKGFQHGPITRLLTPDDLGELLKPFVFLDYLELEPDTMPGFRPHPHSGIATHTTFLEGGMSYGDSTGKSGSLAPGSIEWMQAAGGVWHWGKPDAGSACRGYQLWVSLPPELELMPARSQFIQEHQIASDGRARILLGEYGALRSPIDVALPITYLHVRLSDGETWRYSPNPEHEIAWLATNRGRLRVGDTRLSRELAIFEQGNTPIEVVAQGDAEFVIGSAVRHRHPLICGPSSVHTSVENLHRGLANLEELSSRVAVLSAARS